MKYENQIPQVNLRTFINEEDYPAFCKLKVVRNIEWILQKIDVYGYIETDMVISPIQFLKKLIEFEKCHEREFKNSNYQPRYGIEFVLLLPHGPIDIKTKQQAIRQFIKKVRDVEVNLKYVAWEEVVGMATYIHVYVCDRQYFSSKVEYYTRDYYQNSITKKMCGKEEENAVLVAKKGSVKQRIYQTFEHSKTRRFVYKDDFDKFIGIFLQYWKDTLWQLKMVYESKFVFKRKRFGELNNQYIKRIYLKINRLETIFESAINATYQKLQKRVSIYDAYRYGGTPGELYETKGTKQLQGLYMKYLKRFVKMSFHHNDIEYSLKGRVDIVESNLDFLEELFFEEIKQIEELQSEMAYS